MKFSPVKKLELSGKALLNFIFRGVFPKKRLEYNSLSQIRKILILRLDQRIGNGIILLPLINAIRKSKPNIELHLLIHHPVAELFSSFTNALINRFWPYDQKKLLKNPIKFLSLLVQLHKEKFDLIISSHNPDNFSLSQAILGRFCTPKILEGFSWKDSSKFYDIVVESSNLKHYAESQLDLWRYFDKSAMLKWDGLKVPVIKKEEVKNQLKLSNNIPSALIWLGATGDKVLPISLITFIYEEVKKYTGFEVSFAAGPSDNQIIKILPDWIKNRVILWNEPLKKTAAFFSMQHLFISGDTGPAHLAVALEIPTLIIFLSSNIRQYGYHDGKIHFAIDYGVPPKAKTEVVKALRILGNRISDGD